MQACDRPAATRPTASRPASTTTTTTTCSATRSSALLPLGVAPVYPRGANCNARGLTDLGEHLIRRMMAKRMIVDPDHLSVRARKSVMSLLEAKRYSGRRVQPQLEHPRRGAADLQARRRDHALRRRLEVVRQEVARGGAQGRPQEVLLRLRLRRRHERLRRPGQRPQRARTRSSTRSSPGTASRRSTSRSRASASTTSTRTASPTTASTRTGSRTCAARPATRSSRTWPAARRPTCRCGSAPRA